MRKSSKENGPMSLIDEVTTDPLGRGYASMTDQQVVDDLHTAYRASADTNIWRRLTRRTFGPFLHEAGLPGDGSHFVELRAAQTDASTQWLQGLAADAFANYERGDLDLDYADANQKFFIDALIDGVWSVSIKQAFLDTYLTKTISRVEELVHEGTLKEPLPIRAGAIARARPT